MKLLFTAIGKRVQLINHFKKYFEVIGTDCSSLAPAIQFVDKFYHVSRYDNASYKNELLAICERDKIDILVSLFEPELFIMDSIREKLNEQGTCLILSTQEVLAICCDKWQTYRFFLDNNISTPESFLTLEECNKQEYPLFIKPRKGMGSIQAVKINNLEELNFHYKTIKSPIIQEYVKGIEYTIDCICDFQGKPIAVVPRERMDVRAGEVSKSRTCKDSDIITQAVAVCERLGAVGPITIQCIKTSAGSIKFTEINPRLGGGVPLSFEAGVNYGQIMKDMVYGKTVESVIGQFREMTMLRYDEAVFL